ncbi:virulence factor [Mycolicibacterium anyangense]|uniref:Virulence factor n=1 Tax=Mycolicibacterium anyangense TaxID=1431246 RepID=A0A6N4WAQ3_9MYCO|nr:MCE family protein [Mycolicibacterium anyangense]BBZ77142.1 virulence factor [Mycolicibacterium anyangense]
MHPRKGEYRIAPGWWALGLVVAIVAGIATSWAIYNRDFTTYAPITVTAERSGLSMEPGNPVKMRGVQIGQVKAVTGGDKPVSLALDIDPAELKYIPANVQAQITASTAFGPKYVELLYPSNPSAARLAAGAVVRSNNVATEVNTVFENLVDVLHHVDPAKLNAVLSTFAEGLRGKGPAIGQAISDGNEVLAALNVRNGTIRQDFRSLADASDTYANAAPDLIRTLQAVTTTSATITAHAGDLDRLLLSAAGFAQSGVDLLGQTTETLPGAINILEPTTSLLLKYNPEYTCLLVGSQVYLQDAYVVGGGLNGHSIMADAGLLPGKDPYVYPDNLPIVAAKGGPGGKPGCGSLPDVSKNFPVRQLVTNTGWGTGMDIRPNPGLGHPCFGNYFPVTRAVPQPDTYRCVGPPSPGLVTPPTGPLPFAAPAPADPAGPPPPGPAGPPPPGPAVP